MKVRIIGDVHCHIPMYVRIATEVENSIQIGDMGIGLISEETKKIAELPVLPGHKFFRGNHDNPALCKIHPNYLGDFGAYGDKIFFMAGADSIDKAKRIMGVSWWPDEQLNYRTGIDALELYENMMPEVVLTHDAPYVAANALLNRFIIPGVSELKEVFTNSTQEILQQMWNIHQPKLWIFGHYHVNWEKKIGHTRFVCLHELAYKDITI